MTMAAATMLTVAAGTRVRGGGVPESTMHVQVKMLVSTVNLTMFIRARPLKWPPLFMSLTSYTTKRSVTVTELSVIPHEMI